MTRYVRPRVSIDIVGQRVLEPSGGTVSLDALGIPYGSASVEIPRTEDLELEDMDPRNDIRVIVAGSDDVAGTTRYFNFGLRSREVADNGRSVMLTLGTDEALLQDYSTLAVDSGARAHESSLRGVCNYVLGKVLSRRRNALPNPSGRVDTVGYYPLGPGASLGVDPGADTYAISSTAGTTRGSFGIVLATLTVGVDLEPDTEYRYSAYIYCSYGSSPTRNVLIFAVGAGITSPVESVVLNAVDFIRTDVVFRTTKAGVVNLYILNETTTVAGTNIVAFRDANVEKNATFQTALPYFSGATAPSVGTQYFWEGTPNRSASRAAAALDPVGPDADVTAVWPVTNLHPNPVPASTLGYGAGQGAAAPTYNATEQRVQWTSTGLADSNLIAASSLTSYRVTPGRAYTFVFEWATGGAGPVATPAIQWRNNGSASTLATIRGAQFAYSTQYQRMAVTATAPPGAEYAYPLVLTSNNGAAGKLHLVKRVMFYEDDEVVPFYSGSTPDTADYTYDWSDPLAPNASSSVRTPTRDTPTPEAFAWEPGVTAWDFLEPFTSSAGFRLYSDEARRWYLIDPKDHTVPGLVTLAGFNVTEGSDTISRDDPEVFATGVVVRYVWKDPATRDDKVAYDSAGTPSKVVVITYERPFPGVGAAAAILARRSGTGRTQTATAVVDWTATPGMEASLTLPGSDQTRGKVASVRFSLGDDGLMEVGTRGLIDIPPGSWDAGPASVTWDNVTGTWDTFTW